MKAVREATRLEPRRAKTGSKKRRENGESPGNVAKDAERRFVVVFVDERISNRTVNPRLNGSVGLYTPMRCIL